jgi:DNA-binding FadR family transcriptional regulator
MSIPSPNSQFIHYLAQHTLDNPDDEQLPSLNDISADLGVSVARLREQLEVARALGLVAVRPRTGIKRQPFSFAPAAWHSLAFALAIDPGQFETFANLRKHIELAYFHEAAQLLSSADKDELQKLVDQAQAKLAGTPIRIPTVEHRTLHLLIFTKLENPFVIGILEAYWEAYDAVGLSIFADLKYLNMVWDYHQQMVTAIKAGAYDEAHQALAEHMTLIQSRSTRAS